MKCAECGMKLKDVGEYHPAAYCLLVKNGYLPLFLEHEIISLFVRRVNELAEKNMEKTGKLEGAHYAAMQYELKRIAQRR